MAPENESFTAGIAANLFVFSMLTLYSVVTDSVVPEAASCQSVITFFPSIGRLELKRALAWCQIPTVFKFVSQYFARLTAYWFVVL